MTKILQAHVPKSLVPPKERILSAARELFYARGIRAVSVDDIAEAAQTNKMTLYRHFDSKDLLIAEYVKSLSAEADMVWQALSEKFPRSACAVAQLGRTNQRSARAHRCTRLRYRQCRGRNSGKRPSGARPHRGAQDASARKCRAIVPDVGLRRSRASRGRTLFDSRGRAHKCAKRRSRRPWQPLRQHGVRAHPNKSTPHPLMAGRKTGEEDDRTCH